MPVYSTQNIALNFKFNTAVKNRLTINKIYLKLLNSKAKISITYNIKVQFR